MSRRTEVDEDLLRKLWLDESVKVQDIADRFGVRKDTISNYARHRLGLPSRYRKVDKKLDNEKPLEDGHWVRRGLTQVWVSNS